jgi:hypothetical protein
MLSLFFAFSPTDKVHSLRGILDYLPMLYSATNPESCLHAALGAVAYANFCRRSSMTIADGRRLAKQCYGKALSLVSQATQNNTTASSDDVVMAVSLLGVYEVCLLCRGVIVPEESARDRYPTYWNGIIATTTSSDQTSNSFFIS